MSQSLTINPQQEQTKDELDWLNDDTLLNDLVDTTNPVDLLLEEDFALEDDIDLVLGTKIVQNQIETGKFASASPQNELSVDRSLLSEEESESQQFEGVTQQNVNIQSLSTTSDISPKFTEDNLQVFTLSDGIVHQSSAISEKTITTEIVTIEDEDEIQVIDKEGVIDANLGSDVAVDEYEYEYENGSDVSSDREFSVAGQPYSNQRSARCIVEFSDTSRAITINPAIRLSELMYFLKNDLVSEEHPMQDVCLTFRDPQSRDFLISISQENGYSHQYSLRDVLNLHYGFQRLRNISPSDIHIQVTLYDGFITQFRKMNNLIHNAGRTNSAGNVPQNPIVLDDSNPGTPNESPLPDNLQEDHQVQNNTIIINSPTEGDQKESAGTPHKQSTDSDNQKYARNQLLNIDEDDLAPYSGDEQEDNDPTREEIWDPDVEAVEDAFQEPIDEAHETNLNGRERLKEDVQPDSFDFEEHDDINTNEIIKESDNTAVLESTVFKSRLNNENIKDLSIENEPNIQGQNITISNESKNKEDLDALPDFEEFEVDDIPIENHDDPNGIEENFGHEVWTPDDLLIDTTEPLLDPIITGKRDWDYTHENEVEKLAKKARVA